MKAFFSLTQGARPGSDDHTLDFQHTVVPESLRGSGLGEELVRGALEEARRHGDKVIPTCPYVARFIDRHPEYRHDAAEE